jgi:hypothetical protein
MKKKVILIVSVVMVLAIVFSLTSCGKAVEKITEKAIEASVDNVTDSNVEVSTDDTGVTISNEQGEVQIGGNATIPENWPSEIPLYPDLKITASSSSKDSNNNDGFVIFAEVSKGTVKDVYEWHKSKMSDWEIEQDDYYTTDGNDSFALKWKNNKYEVLLGSNSDGKVISYTISVVQLVNE